MKKNIIFLTLFSLLLIGCNESSSSSSYSSSFQSSSSHPDLTSSSLGSSSSSSSSSQSSSSTDNSKVTGVKFIKKTVRLSPNQTHLLTYKVYPSEAENKNVSFNVKDESVATVDQNGLVTALKIGSTEITIKTEEGNFQDTMTLEVVGEEVQSIKINVPEDTLKDSQGIYLLRVNSTLQLTYTLTPSDAYNKLTFKSTYDNEDASNYLSVTQDGLLTAHDIKTKVVITLSADNLVYDEVIFTVVKDSIYAKYELENLTKKSRNLEKEKVVSGTKKIIHKKPKSYIDTETNETFNIYSNGVSRDFTEIDNDLQKTTHYQGYYGIEDNKFYQIVRDDSGKYKDTSVKNIGSEISLQLATENSSLAMYKTYFSFHDIIMNELFSGTNSFNFTGDWISYNIESSEQKYKITSSYIKKSSSWIVPSTYIELLLEVNIDEFGMISSFVYECSEYNQSDFNSSTQTLKDNATPIDYLKNEFSQTTGTRTEQSSFAVNPQQCYFDSFEVELQYLGEVKTEFNVGDTIGFNVINGSPSTATTVIDQVKFLSSSNEKVVENGLGGVKAIAPGSSTLTYQSEKGKTFSIDVTVQYRDVESVTINLNKNGLKVGETIENITVSSSPYGCDERYSLSIVSGQENATLTYNEETKSYSLNAVQLGKVVLEAVSTANNQIKAQKTLYVYEEINEDQVTETLLNNKFRATYSNGNSYTLTFMENGRGSVSDVIDGIVNNYGSFTYTVEGFNIKISDVRSTNQDYFYGLGDTFTLNSNGIEVTGILKYSQYGNSRLTFVKYEN